jgi:hypothetical protein
MSYKGKEPCQGCGMPGSQVQRYDKNSLCLHCESARKRGLSRDQEDKLTYKSLVIHVHAWRDNEIGDKIVAMLRQMHNEHAECHGSDHVFDGTGYQGSNVWRFSVDARIVPAVREILKIVNTRWYEMKKETEDLPKQAADLANQERTKIFNEGVQHGKQLLVQLNSGHLSLSDFEKDIKSYNSNL